MGGKCRALSQLRLGIELLELLELLAKAGPYFSGSAGKILGGLFWKSKGKAKKSKGKAKSRAKTPLNGAARTPPRPPPPPHTHKRALNGQFSWGGSHCGLRADTRLFFIRLMRKKNRIIRLACVLERKNGELKSAN